MQQALLLFTGILDYDDYASLQVAVAAAGIESTISFFGYPDTFQEFGRKLIAFPNNTQTTVSFEQGEDTGYGQEYLLLEAYYLDQMGHAALRIVMDNKATPPTERRIAFSLPADVASLIKLGQRLLNWQLQLRMASSIEWRPIVS